MGCSRTALAVVAIWLVSMGALPTPSKAQGVDCRAPVEGIASAQVRPPPGFASLTRSPDYPAARAKARREVAAAWAKAVADSCPGHDPNWARAKRRSVRCGFLSSSSRYSCIRLGIPAAKAR